MKHKIITLMLALCLTFSITACGESETETSNTQQQTETTEQEQTEELASDEDVVETAPEKIIIELIAGEQGQYGEMITMSEGTDLEESFYVYYLPAGTYEVTNIGEYMTQVSVYEDFEKNEETGYDEYTNTGDIVLLDVEKTDTIEVPDGWFIEIHEPTHISLTLKETSNADTTSTESELDAIGSIDVNENLFDIELTIPKDYIGETSQDELNTTAKEKGYKSITLNEDGSATYVMTKKQHQELLDNISDSINTGLSEMIGSEDYPNYTEITANEDFTSFSVITKSTELNFTESISVMAFYMYGGMYNIFAGTPVDNIHIDFINADSGEIISSANSKDIE